MRTRTRVRLRGHFGEPRVQNGPGKPQEVPHDLHELLGQIQVLEWLERGAEGPAGNLRRRVEVHTKDAGGRLQLWTQGALRGCSSHTQDSAWISAVARRCSF